MPLILLINIKVNNYHKFYAHVSLYSKCIELEKQFMTSGHECTEKSITIHKIRLQLTATDLGVRGCSENTTALLKK